MTKQEFKQNLIDAIIESESEFIGVRFDKINPSVGQQLEWSRSNSNRQDERDFPEYGDGELLNGTCVYGIPLSSGLSWYETEDEVMEELTDEFVDYVYGNGPSGTHCSIVTATKESSIAFCEDEYEKLFVDAVVVSKLW